MIQRVGNGCLEAHARDATRGVALAEEFHFFSSEVTVLGTYKASPFCAALNGSAI